MSYTYEKHCEEMKQRGHKPMSKAHFNEMQGIGNEPVVPPLHIRPKNQRPIDATHRNYDKTNS